MDPDGTLCRYFDGAKMEAKNATLKAVYPISILHIYCKHSLDYFLLEMLMFRGQISQENTFCGSGEHICVQLSFMQSSTGIHEGQRPTELVCKHEIPPECSDLM